jgi:sensor domain CHASE-containing protein
MKLMEKVSLVVLVVICLYAGAEWMIQKTIVFPGFMSLEQNEAQSNMQRAYEALENETAVLANMCHDWAAWDDTYRFIVEQNQDYMESNLIEESYTDLKLNILLFYDAGGNYVAGEGYDLAAGEYFDFREILPVRLDDDHPLRRLTSTVQDSVAGVMDTVRGPMVVAAQPIITSQNKGPVRGTVIMGWLLDNVRIARLREQVVMDLAILPINTGSFAEQDRQALAELEGSAVNFASRIHDDVHLDAYAAYPDINGNPLLLIKAELPRDISRQGRQTIRNSLTSTLLIGISIIFVLALVGRQLICQPIMKLVNHIATVKKTGELAPIRMINRQDELGALAEEFSSLIEELDRKNKQERQNKKEREKLIAELQEALSRVKVLSGMLPICSSCKKIRDDKGYWNQIESYIRAHSDAEFSHGICPECTKKLYGKDKVG